MSFDPRLIDELETVRRANPEGVLLPTEALEYARAHPESALHARVNWDDASAADQHRLNVIRGIIREIRIVVREQQQQHSIPIRAFVSLSTADDKECGYQPAQIVIEDQQKRQHLLLDILDRIEATLRGHPLPELAEVVSAVARCRARYGSGFAEAAE
jgi:hypothetical protein